MRLPGGEGKTKLPVKRGRLGAATGDFLACQWPGHRRCFAPFSNSPVPLCLGAEENAQRGAAVAEVAKLSPLPCHSKRAGNVSARRGRGAGLAYVKPVPNEKRGGSIALPPLFWTVCGDDFANRSLLAFGAAKRAVFPSAESATPAQCIFLPLFLPCRKSRTG